MPITPTRDVLLGCLAVPRWADDVLARGPFSDRQTLLAAAEEAARALSEEEIVQALSGHPRIGERGGARSRREQAEVEPAVGDVGTRLAVGNAAYEDRFDRIFLIRAAGRDAEEILGELTRRLANDDATERDEVVDNLRQIALLRLEESV